MSSISQLVAKNIRKLREKHSLSQKDLAYILGVKQQAVYYYEKGYRSVPFKFLDTLCHHFGLAPSFFLQDEEVKDIMEDFPLKIQQAIYKVSKLKPEQQNQVVNFIDFLAHKNNKNGTTNPYK